MTSSIVLGVSILACRTVNSAVKVISAKVGALELKHGHTIKKLTNYRKGHSSNVSQPILTLPHTTIRPNTTLLYSNTISHKKNCSRIFPSYTTTFDTNYKQLH